MQTFVRQTKKENIQIFVEQGVLFLDQRIHTIQFTFFTLYIKINKDFPVKWDIA